MRPSKLPTDEEIDPGTHALIRWEATRRAWLQPQTSPIPATPSSSCRVIPQPSCTSPSQERTTTDAQKELRKKFDLAFEKMTYIYDQQAQFGHPDGAAKKVVGIFFYM